MYQVFIRQGWNGEETLIHSAHVNELKLISPQITYDVTAFPAFTFSIYPDNPGYSMLNYLTTFVRVYKPSKHRNVFEGRVLLPTETLDTSGDLHKEVTCEQLGAFLHDSVQPFQKFAGQTRAQILQSLITAHNTQVDSYKQLKLGNVSLGTAKVADTYTDDSATTYDNISTLILASGFELAVRHESDGLYVDCAKSIGGTGIQQIRLKGNLLSATRSIDPSALITVLKPLGQAAESADTNTDESTARLTIASANGGSPYLKDADMVAQFGTIVGTNEWDDVTDAKTLLTTGQAYLKTLNTATVSVQVSAVDVSVLGGDVDELLCGYSYPTKVPVMGIDESLRITQQTLDLNDATAGTITLGDRVVGQESYNAVLTNALAGLKKFNKQLIADRVRTTAALTAANNAVTQLAALSKKVDALTTASDDGVQYDPTGYILDVSKYQADINWPTLVSAGLAIAVIRIQDGSSVADTYYKTNIQGAIDAGANYGVYAFFRAVSETDAETEAGDFYTRVQSVVGSQRQPRLWMIDVETNPVTEGTLKAALTSYMDQLNVLGVPDSRIVVYVSTSLYSSINTIRPAALWVPRYGTNDGTVSGSTKPDVAYDLWQYTSVGTVPGISGDVDMSTDPSTKFKVFLTKG
ncbi:phage tail spike protein [Lacticaseibacillus hulanensis]|uniref:phage tail spike protein n=1 Tax=Lacticaseibacillus hulanensis TaxID=2493111 RepID=UPI000FDBF4CB|nr:phage tail spike protein [Lacticaseibacillus hulanensis]